MVDLVVTGGTVVDGTGAAPRVADVAITDGIVTEVADAGALAGTAATDDRRRRPARHARLRRRAHALRRPGHLGPAAHADVLARRHHGRDGQLRRRLRAGAARQARVAHRPDGRRRGHPRRRAVRGHPVGLGVVPRVPRRGRRRCPKSLDVGTQVPHGAVRGYVMGERGAKNEPATADDIEAMAAIVRDGIEAGALGFSTSRTIAHMAIDGEPVPGHVRGRGRAVRHRPRARRARHRRVRARARRRARRGPRRARPRDGLDAPALGRDRAARSRSRSPRTTTTPTAWRRMLELAGEAARRGRAGPPAGGGPAGEPAARPADVPPVRVLPEVGADRAAPARREGREAARDPELRAQLVRERRRPTRRCCSSSTRRKAFPLGDPPDYEPKPSDSVAARAAAAGRDTLRAVSTTLLLEDDGRALVMRPLLNYTDFEPRRGARDAPAPHERVGPRRRRRALRHHVRREHAHVHAHALGARPRPRPAAARVGRAAR